MAARKEILFDGYFYDVTDFIETHPGGTVIEYYTEKGEDGTHAIQQFHKHSIEKVTVMMSALKKRPATDSEIGLDAAVLKKNRSLTEDLAKLHLELERDGYFEPSYTQAFMRLMELVLFFGIGCTLVYNYDGFLRFVGLTSIFMARVRASFLMHELGHLSLTGNPKFDRLLHNIVYGFFNGLSATRWRRTHNRHHAMPQRENHDVDLETMPLLAFNAKVAKNSKFAEVGKKFHIQYQAYLFAVDSLLVGLFWVLYKDPKFMIKRKLYLEIATAAAFYVVYYQLGFWAWLTSNWFGSICAIGTFSLNHTFLPVASEPTHWVEYGLIHTADVEHAPWCDYIMGHLNYQIEHHLFPTMPQFRLPYIKDRVRKLAEKHNIPYIYHTYPEAWRVTFKNMADVAKELRNS